VCNADDAWSARLAAGAPGLARVVTFRSGAPGPGELGVTGGALVDRAFGGGDTLALVSDVQPAAPHNVSNALAAAALARAYGVVPAAVAAGLHAFQPEPHRITMVARVGEVTYVDDSQALARHAPDVPVVELAGTDTGIMERVVSEAAAVAAPGDTVLLAPAAASLDMFASYGARGDAFAAAVRALAGVR
jgi:UDP-N-acetylmuramoylalanine--D-glutamate ligase